MISQNFKTYELIDLLIQSNLTLPNVDEIITDPKI